MGRYGPLAWSVCFVAVCVMACAPARRGAQVASSQREAIERLRVAAAEDAALQRALLDALLAVSRERLLARIEDETVARYVDAAGEPRRGALRDDVRVGVRTFLSGAVADGAMTLDDAETLLMRYAALLRAGAGADVRRAPLTALNAVAAHADAASAIREGFERRARDVRALLADAGASGAALGALMDDGAQAPSAAMGAGASLWRTAVLERIDDEERRAAGERVLAQALGIVTALTGADTHGAEGDGR